jgi:hypothetical protein
MVIALVCGRAGISGNNKGRDIKAHMERPCLIHVTINIV